MHKTSRKIPYNWDWENQGKSHQKTARNTPIQCIAPPYVETVLEKQFWGDFLSYTLPPPLAYGIAAATAVVMAYPLDTAVSRCARDFDDESDIVDGRNPANQLRLVVSPIIYKLFTF